MPTKPDELVSAYLLMGVHDLLPGAHASQPLSVLPKAGNKHFVGRLLDKIGPIFRVAWRIDETHEFDMPQIQLHVDFQHRSVCGGGQRCLQPSRIAVWKTAQVRRQQATAKAGKMEAMAKRRVSAKLWFAAENLDLECYRAKVGSGYIVFSIGNVTKLPFKRAEVRQKHICRIVADNIHFFFLSRHSESFLSEIFSSHPSVSDKAYEWLGKNKGRPVYSTLRKMVRRFNPSSEVTLGQFERACLAQSKLPSAEYSVVPHILAGLTDKEIAAKLGNSPETVAKYVASIRELLGIRREEGSSHKDRAGLLLALLGN